MSNPVLYKYLIMTAINITPFIGGKYFSTAYAAYNHLNPFLSISIITVSETISCAVLFFIGYRLKFLKSLSRLLNSKKTRKAHDYVIKYGPVIGLFVGQMFIGAPPISLALGIIYDKERNIFLFFFLPLFTSIFLYSIFNFYLNTAAILSVNKIIHSYKDIFRIF